MKKLDYFLKAIQIGNYKRLDWIRSVFCLISESEEDYKKDPFPYRIIQKRDGIFFLDPANDLNPTKIVDADITKELFDPAEKINLKAKDLENLDRDITTPIGNVLVNAICLIYPFGNKIPFLEGELSVKGIEKIIINKLEDNPENPEDMKPDRIYISEYLKFTEAMFLIRELADIFTPTASEKILTPPPGVVELRKKLVEERKDRLNDPAVLAEIDTKLAEYDTEYLKGDEDAAGFLRGKLRGEVRRKLFLTVGSQAGFGDGTHVEHVEKSLAEGVDIKSLPIMNSGTRAGSFNRGYQTMHGGTKFKELLRAAANAKVEIEDCGTKLGKTRTIQESDKNILVGQAVITSSGYEYLTEENFKNYVGKTVSIRSPRYCKAEKTDYCKVCMGKKLSIHPTAVSIALSNVGSDFLTLFLKKMHVSGLSTQKMDFKEVIS